MKAFKKNKINSLILKLAIPAIFTMISQTVIMVTDTAMVGQLNANAIASTGIGGWIVFTCLSFFFGASGAIQILTSRYLGAKKNNSIKLLFIIGSILTLIAGIIISLITIEYADEFIAFMTKSPTIAKGASTFLVYRMLGFSVYVLVLLWRGFFDGLGFTYISMLAASITMFANVFLNWILIYGNLGCPELGIKGAAIASSLSSIPGLVIQVAFLFKKDIRKILSSHTENIFSQTGAILKSIHKYATPISVDNLLLHFSFLLFFKIAGMVSDISLASANIIVSIMSLSFMPGNGFAIAATTILGNSIGAGQYKRGRVAVFRSALFAAIVMGSLGILFIVFDHQILKLFTNDALVIDDAIVPLFIVSLFQVADAYHMVFVSALRTAGYMKRVLVLYFLLSYFGMLPIAYGFAITLDYNSTGLWLGVGTWLLAGASVFVFLFKRINWKSDKVLLASQT